MFALSQSFLCALSAPLPPSCNDVSQRSQGCAVTQLLEATAAALEVLQGRVVLAGIGSRALWCGCTPAGKQEKPCSAGCWVLQHDGYLLCSFCLSLLSNSFPRSSMLSPPERCACRPCQLSSRYSASSPQTAPNNSSCLSRCLHLLNLFSLPCSWARTERFFSASFSIPCY